MKVRLKVEIEEIGKKGEVVEVSDDDARVMICAGYASGYKEIKPEAEVKEQAPVENTGRKRRLLK